LSPAAPTVTIVSDPPGVPLNVSANIFEYPILSSVNLTCMIDPMPTTAVAYQWNTIGCYSNDNFNRGDPKCFPRGKSMQTVTGNDLTAEDVGTIACSVTIGSSMYISKSLELIVSGMNSPLENFVDVMHNTCHICTYYKIFGGEKLLHLMWILSNHEKITTKCFSS